MPRNSSFIYKNKPVDVKEVAELKPPDVTVGTKVRISSPDFHRISEAVAKSLEGSLVRLRLDRVDIFHLHNAITETGNGEALSVRQVLNDVLPAFERLRQQGKTRFLGLTAIGDTAALHQVIDARVFDSAQVIYNMLNPSAAVGLPAELLKEIAPGIKRVAFIFDPKVSPGGGSYYTRLIEASAATSAVVPTVAPVHDAVEIERAIGEFAREQNGGLVVLPDATTLGHRELFVALAARHRVPAIYAFRDIVVDGGLISYGIDVVEQYRQAAGYVDRILKGAKPADLLVQLPAKFEMTINLKTAKTLGLDVPLLLQQRADEVIE